MFDLIPLIKAVGYLGVAGIIFAESGIFLGFFLPGDSLLFTAGFLASQGYLNVWLLIALTFIGAVAGDSVGYAFGKKIGPKLFSKPESRFFHPEHAIRAKVFFEKYGAKTIILARFFAILRTFVPIVAGIGTMSYKKFLINNIIGAFLWTAGLSLGGYYLGKSIPNADAYLLPIILLIVIISGLPTLIHVLKRRKM